MWKIKKAFLLLFSDSWFNDETDKQQNTLRITIVKAHIKCDMGTEEDVTFLWGNEIRLMVRIKKV